jgi:hypothetical protein
MTQDEMNRDLADAQTYLSVTNLTARRCEHASVTETSLWLFDKDNRQIGCISRLPGPPVTPDYRWQVSRMHRGMPVSRRCERTLLDCIGDITRYEPKS